MSDKPNARELLKEARAELAKAHDHLMELTAKLPMQYFGLVDGDMIQAEDCFIDKISAYLSAPDEDAMEVVQRIRDWHRVGVDGVFMSNRVSFNLSDSEAAALITAHDAAIRAEAAALRSLVRRMREALTENSLWPAEVDALCAEADKALQPNN